MLRLIDVAELSCAIAFVATISGCSGNGSSVLKSAQSQAQASVRAIGADSGSISVTELPRPADAFVDSIGVVTHFHYPDTPYVKQYGTVRNLLVESGIRHIRDGISANYTPYYGYLREFLTHGIRTDGVAAIDQPISDIVAFSSAVPGALESIEAPNEYDLSGDKNWVTDIRAYQKFLYTGVKSSSLLASMPVLSPSLTSFEAYRAVGDLSTYVDGGNMHNYFGAGNPGSLGGAAFPPGNYGSIPFFVGSARLVSGTKPVTTTETGYEDLLTDPSPVSSAIKVKYTMRTILEQWNALIARTYFYELVDEGGQSYGIISPGLEPKPVYYALKNLTHKLSDGGAAFKLLPLSYTLAADPSVHHALLQKRDGSYRLMLWVESRATDPIQQEQAVTVICAAKFRTVVQYEWQDSGNFTTSALSQSAAGAITLRVSDRVTELKLQQ